MITILAIHNTDDKTVIADFFKSINAQHSGTIPYEIISQDCDYEIPNRASEPSPESKITITLPTNSLVLGNSWDKYIQYALDNGLPKHHTGKIPPTWESCVVKWMNLTDRRHSGVFFEVSVKLALATV